MKNKCLNAIVLVLLTILGADVAFAKQALIAEYIVPAAEKDKWNSPNKIFNGYNTETQKGFTFKRKGPIGDGYYNYYLEDKRLGANFNALGCWITTEVPEQANLLPATYTRSIASPNSPACRYVYSVHYAEEIPGIKVLVDYETRTWEGWISGEILSDSLERWVINQRIDSSPNDYNWRHASELAPYVQCIHTDFVYAVTFDPGDKHAGSMPPQSVTNSAPLASCTFACLGCTFSGWATSDGGSVAYKDGATIGAKNDLKDDMCLYAVWSPITYSIQFNGNGGSGSQAAISAIKYHDEVTIPGCAFSLSGYGFSGWATNQNGRVVFRENDKVSSLTTANNSTVTLYACWDPLAKISVTFDASPGALVGENPRPYTPGLAYGELPTAVREGYDFVRWTDASGKDVYAETLVPGEPHTLYAKWRGREYAVYFYDDAEAAPLGSQSGFVYGEAQALKTVSQLHFSKKGYDFVGWSTNESDRVAVYADGAVVSNLTTEAETDLYAVTALSPSYVAFDPSTNVVTGVMPVQTCPCLTAVNLAPCAFSRTGYSFKGWAAQAGGKIRYGDAAEYTAPADYAHKTNTLYAVWKANSYTVTFDPNGGPYAPDPAAKAYEYDAQYGSLATVTNDEGTAFAGWYTERVGGEWIATNAVVAITNDTTFYAHWIAAPFALAFDAQGGGFTNGLATLTVSDRYVDGQPYGEFPSVTNAADKVFAGWWDSPDAAARTQLLVTDKASLKLKTLYARWKTAKPAQSVAVVFDANGGTGGASFSCDVGTVVGALPPDPTRTGHRFVGWFGAREGGARISPDSVVLCATNYYARWSDLSVEAVLGRFDGVSFQTDAVNGWFEETDEESKCGGKPTMRSGAIGNNATSTLTAYLELGGGSVSFDWAVWSRGNSHPLLWKVNGVRVKRLECEQGKWATRVDEQVQQTLSADVSKLSWVYQKNDKAAEFSDRGWLANLSWKPTPVLPPIWDWATNAVRANLTFETGGMKPWTMAAADAGIRSGASVGDSAYSWVRATATGSGTLSFRWRTDCENGYVDAQGNARLTDRLEFRVDGVVAQAIGGESAWSVVATNVVAAAETQHMFEWRYVKDDDTSVGEDCAWLDDVVWTPSAPVHPEPTPADRRDIASVTMADGKLRMTFTNADERFDYQLRGTNDLVVPMPWPALWTTNGTGTLVIEPPKTEDPQMFYYLQVIRKR